MVFLYIKNITGLSYSTRPFILDIVFLNSQKNNPKGSIQDCKQIGKYFSVCILPANERRSGTCLTAATWMLSGRRQLQKEPKKSYNT